MTKKYELKIASMFGESHATGKFAIVSLAIVKLLPQLIALIHCTLIVIIAAKNPEIISVFPDLSELMP